MHGKNKIVEKIKLISTDYVKERIKNFIFTIVFRGRENETLLCPDYLKERIKNVLFSQALEVGGKNKNIIFTTVLCG